MHQHEPNVTEDLSLNDLITIAHTDATAAGWWQERDGLLEQHEPHFLNSKLMLIVTELAEACEDVRAGGAMDRVILDPESKPIGKPVGIASELADAVIRIADLCGEYDVPLVQAIRQKLAYNRKRGLRHGGKKA